jgi:ATP-dependent Zn protease
MPLFRVTLVDTAGRQQIKEVHAGNICGAKQQALLQVNAVHPGVSHRYQDKSVVIRSVVKIDIPNT